MSQGPESDGGSPAAGTPGTGDDDRRQPPRSGGRRRGGRGRGGRGGRGRSGQGQTGNGSTGNPAAASTAPAGTQPRRQNRGPSPAEQTAAGSGAAAPAAKTTGKTTAKTTGKGARKSPAGARLDDPRTGRRRRPRRWLRQVDEFSAGGLVLDFTGDVPRGALIGRTDRQGRLLWSLPKGHIEAGETAEQAAVREVEEETGIAGVILGELGVIDFWFVADGRRIHKTVRHYLMRRVGGELSDADIEVDEVAWVALPQIRAQLAYPDERGLVDTAGKMLAEPA